MLPPFDVRRNTIRSNISTQLLPKSSVLPMTLGKVDSPIEDYADVPVVEYGLKSSDGEAARFI